MTRRIFALLALLALPACATENPNASTTPPLLPPSAAPADHNDVTTVIIPATPSSGDTGDGTNPITTRPSTTDGSVGVNRVVYIIDHSGSMINTFDFLREKMKASLKRLTPAQKFAVLAVGEKVDASFPKEKTLASAIPESKRQLADFLDTLRAAGKNDDALDPFADAFTDAFAMNPQVIYFLVDGSVSPKLADKIKELNKTAKIKIHTIAFIKVTKETEELLKTIAADSGGNFKYITEKDLGK